MARKLYKLRKLRKDMMITQAEVAEYLGVTSQFYGQVERGVNVLSYENALKLARYFHTNSDDLFADDILPLKTKNEYLLREKYDE